MSGRAERWLENVLIGQRSGLIWKLGLLGLALVFTVGCIGLSAGGVNSLLSGQLEDMLANVDPSVLSLLGDELNLDTAAFLNLESVVVQIVNQSQRNVELDLLVDDEPLTLSCSAMQEVCRFDLMLCPSVIEAVEERRTDAFGGYSGGRIFNGADEFTFLEGEFNCESKSVIIFQLQEHSSSAFVL